MTTFTNTSPSDGSSDANFRAWVAAFIAGVTAVGIVQTSDTGQINPVTVLAPSTVNQSRGYAMFKFNDALQATSPCFLKVEFGSNNTTSPSIWATVGIATDGAGNLTGSQISTRQQVNRTGAGGATLYTSYFSGDTNRLCIVMWANSVNRIMLAWERAHDAAGADSGAAQFVQMSNSSGNQFHPSQFVPSSGPVATQEQFVQSLGPGTRLIGTTVGVCPVYPIYGAPQNPSRNIVCTGAADIAFTTVFVCLIYGISQTWLQLTGFSGVRDQTYMTLAMRWD